MRATRADVDQAREEHALEVRARRARRRQIVHDLLGWAGLVFWIVVVVLLFGCSAPTTRAIEADTARLRDCEARYELADTMADVRAVDLLCADAGAP